MTSLKACLTRFKGICEMLPYSLVALLLSIVAKGPGALSIDHLLGKRNP